jgi:putative membrane protein
MTLERILLRLVASALAVLLAASLPQSGVTVQEFGITVALLFALVLGLLNAIVRPILLLLTLPLNFVTLGLFTLIINAVVFWLATLFPLGVHVDGFRGAFIGALFVTVVSFIASRIVR